MSNKFIPLLKTPNILNTQKEKLICSADFETLLIDNEHFVFAVGLYYQNDTFDYLYIDENLTNNEDIKLHSKKLLIKFIDKLIDLARNKEKLYIYMHNLGNFDGIFILKYIADYNISEKEFDSVIRNNKIYKINIKNLVFLDSMLISNQSLDNLADTLLDKKKIVINYDLMLNYESCLKNFDEIIEYLFLDVKLLYKIITNFRNKFLQLFNVDITINYTIPSIAMHIYRAKYLEDDIYIPQMDIYTFINKSYKGGLNNIIVPKITDGFIYDINSLYPYIMRNCELPVGPPN